MLKSLLLGAALLVSISAQSAVVASPKIQLMCKEKAKEVAQSTYTTCLNESRESEIEKVKQDYKEKLDKLKSYYEKKLKALSAGLPAKTTTLPSKNVEASKQAEPTIKMVYPNTPASEANAQESEEGSLSVSEPTEAN